MASWAISRIRVRVSAPRAAVRAMVDPPWITVPPVRKLCPGVPALAGARSLQLCYSNEFSRPTHLYHVPGISQSPSRLVIRHLDARSFRHARSQDTRTRFALFRPVLAGRWRAGDDAHLPSRDRPAAFRILSAAPLRQGP